MKQKRIGIIIVSYGHLTDITKLITSLKPQTQKTDHIVIIDHHPDKKTYEYFKNEKNVEAMFRKNDGFSAGCNAGAEQIRDKVDILLFINPDIDPGNVLLAKIREADYDKYAAVMPLIVLPDNRLNSAGNVVHTTGLSWCDKMYQPISSAKNITEVTVISGACMALSTDWWSKLDGLDENYFMYCEDTDISARIIAQGGVIGLLQDCQVIHHYEFTKGDYKMIYIERNVPLYVIKNWPLLIIILLLPQNIIAGIGFYIVSILQGRFLLKLRSTYLFWKALPVFLKTRRTTQNKRVISSYDFLMTLHPKIDSAVLPSIMKSKLVNYIFLLNYHFATLFLKLFNTR